MRKRLAWLGLSVPGSHAGYVNMDVAGGLTGFIVDAVSEVM